MAQKKRAPQDATGKSVDKAEADKVEAEKAAKAEKEAAEAAAKEQDNVVTDGKGKAVAVDEAVASDEAPVVVGEDTVRVKCIFECESDIGPEHYSFEAGKKYDVPRFVAEFLSERDYLEVLE